MQIYNMLAFKHNIYMSISSGMWLALVAQLDVSPTGDQEVSGLTPTGLVTFLHGN